MALTQRAFTAGSEFPPTTKGKLRVYSMRFCPYAHRARLVLAHRNIDHEVVNINLSNKPQWFVDRNPLGAVPVVELDDDVIYESTAVCEWLDDFYPGPKLSPSDPTTKAKDRMLLEYFGKVTSSFYGILFKKEGWEKNIEDIHKHYHFLEEALAKRGTKFFGGDEVAMIDLLMWPHMERNPYMLAEIEPRTLITRDTYPLLSDWMAAMLEVPAVKATLLDKDSHLSFGRTYFAKLPVDYDYNLKE